MVTAVSTCMGDRLLDFVGNPVNATFGGSGGLRDDIPSSPDPGVQGKVSRVLTRILKTAVRDSSLMKNCSPSQSLGVPLYKLYSVTCSVSFPNFISKFSFYVL